MNKVASTTVAGLALALAAAIPSHGLVVLLRGPGHEAGAGLLAGIAAFRVCLLLLGGYVVFLGRFAAAYPAPRAGVPAQTPASRPEALLFAAILAVAAVVRLYGLGGDLWFDEMATYVRDADLPIGELVSTYESQNQHFLYSILAKLTMAAFGDSPWSLRLPAVIFGVAGIWALYRLGMYVANRREALLAAGLVALSYHHVWFSQNARGYTGLMFFTLLSSWLLLRGLAERRPVIWVAYAVMVALGMYTHLTMLFTVAGHLVIYLFRGLRGDEEPWQVRLHGWFFGFVLSGLLTLQLYALVLPGMFGGTLKEGGAVAAWKNPLWAAVELLRGLQLGFAGATVGIAGAVVFVAGTWRYLRHRPVVLELLFLPVGICATAVLAAGHHLWPRFFFFAMGFGVLVAIAGAFALGGIAGRLLRIPPGLRSLPGTLIAAAMILVSASTVPTAYLPKQDFRGALHFVESSRRPGDAVVAVGLAVMPYRDYLRTGWEVAESEEELQAIVEKAERTWVVYTLPFHLEAVHPEIHRKIEGEFAEIQNFYGTLGGGTVFVRRRDRPAEVDSAAAGH